MARWFLDIQPLLGQPWRLGVATEPRELDRAFQLRHDVFFRETGYGGPDRANRDRDIDEFDEWADQLILWDDQDQRLIATCRALSGTKAKVGNGFYGAAELDLSPLDAIAPWILQGSRTCVIPEFRDGAAVRYLSYGMEVLLREYGAKYFLGFDSFKAKDDHDLNAIHSYLNAYSMDPEFRVEAQPDCRVDSLRIVPVTPADERRLPGVLRIDLKLGFRAIAPPVWDPDFRCHDVCVLGRRDRLTKMYQDLLNRIERPRR